MEQYVSTGRFPENGAGVKGHIETEVKTQHWWEFIKVYVLTGSFALLFSILLKAVRFLFKR